MPPIPQVSAQNIGQPGSTSASSSGNNLSAGAASGGGDKGPDYVYFERKPAQFGESTLGKAMAAKMKLELYYKEAVEGVVGRKQRLVAFRSCGQSMTSDSGLENDYCRRELTS
jgi:protein-serine/threonine kinase